MTRFPWAETMAFGLGVLRLAPQTFWAMTPRELAAAHSGVKGRIGGAPDRETLGELMTLFPDGDGQ